MTSLPEQPPPVPPRQNEPDPWVSLGWLLIFVALAACPLLQFWLDPQPFEDKPTIVTSNDPDGILRIRSLVVMAVVVSAAAYVVLTGQVRPGAHLLWIGAIVYAASGVFSGFYGLEPQFRGTMLLMPTIFTVMYLLPPIPIATLGSWVKKIVLFNTYGTIVATVVVPDRVLEPGYAGWIPGFDYRLHGLGLHANGLAPILVCYFVVRIFIDGRQGGFSFHDLVVLAVLVLAQSKMAVVALILAMIVGLEQFGAFRLPQIRWIVVLFTLLMGFVMTSMESGDAPIMTSITQFFSPSTQSQLLTLTGRTQVWRETSYLWELNPWFGYGPGLWDKEMQLRYFTLLGWNPPQAHSQFYQTLGEAGILGLIGLSFYLICLTVSAQWATKRFPGAPCFVVLLISRGITEPSLEANLDGGFFSHVMAFAIIALALKLDAAEAAAPPTVPRAVAVPLRFTPRALRQATS